MYFFPEYYIVFNIGIFIVLLYTKLFTKVLIMQYSAVLFVVFWATCKLANVRNFFVGNFIVKYVLTLSLAKEFHNFNCYMSPTGVTCRFSDPRSTVPLLWRKHRIFYCLFIGSRKIYTYYRRPTAFLISSYLAPTLPLPSACQYRQAAPATQREERPRRRRYAF